MSEINQKMIGAKWAIALGATMLAGMTVISLLAAHDKGQLQELETVVQPTALGDNQYAAPVTNLSIPVAVYQGKQLFALSLDPEHVRDPIMIREGMDDSGKLSIYKSPEPKHAGRFFIKTANSAYWKTEAR
jgi:hypothetical protein